MQVNVQADIEAVNRDLSFSVPNISTLASLSAMNKTTAKIRTQFRRKLATETGVAQKHFKNKVKLYRAASGKPTARVFMGLRATVPLSKLVKGPKGVGKYSKLITESLEGKTSANVFQAKMGSGYTGLFVRKKKARNATGTDSKGRPRKNRLPIQEVRVHFERVAPKVLDDAGDAVGPNEFEKQYTREMKFRLERAANASTGSRRSRS